MPTGPVRYFGASEHIKDQYLRRCRRTEKVFDTADNKNDKKDLTKRWV